MVTEMWKPCLLGVRPAPLSAALKSYVLVAVPLPGGFGNVNASDSRFTLPVGGCASNATEADGFVGVGSKPDQSMWNTHPTCGSLPGPPLPITLPSILTVPLLPPAPAAPAVEPPSITEAAKSAPVATSPRPVCINLRRLVILSPLSLQPDS